MSRTVLVTTLLLGVLAVGAFAQDDANLTLQMDAETKEALVQLQVLNWKNVNGIDAHGGIVRNGDEYTEDGDGDANGFIGPCNGPGAEDEDNGDPVGGSDKSMDVDQTGGMKKQLRLRKLNYDAVNGIDAHGGIARHGADYAGEGGSHGPVGPGPDEDEDAKAFGGEIDAVDGDATMGNISGPGDSLLKATLDRSGFGPGDEGVGAAITDGDARSQARGSDNK